METIIRQWFEDKAVTGLNIKKFINSHFDIKLWLENKLLNKPEFEKISYVILCILKNRELKKCLKCDKTLKYHALVRGNDYCSLKCMANSKETKQKRIEACMKKYGVEHSSMSKEVREKNKKTNIERYGVEHAAQCKLIKEKTKRSNLEKYGVDCPLKLEKVKEKIKETNIKRYGVENVAQFDEVKAKIKNTNMKRYGVEYVQQNKDIRKKGIDTNIKKYGVENLFQLEQIKEKIRKSCLDKYGVEYPLQCVVVQNKIKKTNIDRYGVENTFQSDDKKQLIKKTMLQKYGVENPQQSSFLQEKRKKTLYKVIYKRFSRWRDYVVPLFSEEEYQGLTVANKWKCAKCGNKFEQEVYTTCHIKEFQTVPRCLKCFPFMVGFSHAEREVSEFIKQYFTDVIENDRSIIAPLELDIVVPSKKIAIEFDGLFWHSESNGMTKEYHLNKTKRCEEKGYRLIHIFEDEWIKKQEIIKAKLKLALDIEQDKVFARKCEIKEIKSKVKNEFLEKYHLQGIDNSSVRLALFDGRDIVAVMTFSKSRFNKKYEWEFVRYSSSKNVIGGSVKLLTYFEEVYNPKSIVTYVDRRFFEGDTYEKMGFRVDHFSDPNYWWTKGFLKLNRYECQKHLLSKLLGDKFNKKLSNSENMLFSGYDKIYDCGNIVYFKVR